MHCDGLAAPDLLRRFVPTPFVLCLEVGETKVTIETNDRLLITELTGAGVLAPGIAKNVPMSWKLVRDQDAPCGGKRITVVESDSLKTFFIGLGTTITIDRDLGELVGFIAPDLSATEFVAKIVPLLFSH